MSEIVSWAKETAKDTYGKFRSPLYLTFVLAVLVWHWEIVLYLSFTDHAAALIVYNLKSGLYPIRWIEPFVTTAVLHFFYPMLQVASDRWANTISIAVAIVVDNWDIRLRAIKKAREDKAELAANLDGEVLRLQKEIDHARDQQDKLRETQQQVNRTNAELVNELADMQAQTSDLRDRLVDATRAESVHQFDIHFESGSPQQNYNEAERRLRESGELENYTIKLQKDVTKIGSAGIVTVVIDDNLEPDEASRTLHRLFPGMRIDHFE